MPTNGTTNIADFKVYPEDFNGGVIEMLQQNEMAFNDASNNTIRLLTEGMASNFKRESFWKNVGAGIVARQDVNSNASQTDNKLEMGEHVEVKLFRKILPYKVTQNSFDEIGGDAQGDASYIIGKQAGQAMSLEMLNTALKIARVAIAAQATNIYDATGDTVKNVTHSNLAKAIAKFGDKSNRIQCFVMHSTMWHDFIQQGLIDGIQQVAEGIVNAYRIPTFAKPFVVTDSDALLVTADNPDSGYVLGLTEDAVRLSKIGDVRFLSQLITGEEQLAIRFQGEYKYSAGLKGFAWDATNGGANPTDAALATATNWDPIATSSKDLAGVVLKVNPMS